LAKQKVDAARLEAFYSVCNMSGAPPQQQFPPLAIIHPYIQVTTPLDETVASADRTLIVQNATSLALKITKVNAYTTGVTMKLKEASGTLAQGLNKIPVAITFPKHRDVADIPVSFKLFVNNDLGVIDGEFHLTKDVSCGQACTSCVLDKNNKPTCLSCRFEVDDLNPASSGQSQYGGGETRYVALSPGEETTPLYCDHLPPGAPFQAIINGRVWPLFLSNVPPQHVCGTFGVPWYFTLEALARDTPDKKVAPFAKGSHSGYQILSPVYAVTFAAQGLVPSTGRLWASVGLPYDECWSIAKGTMALSHDFGIVVNVSPIEVPTPLKGPPAKGTWKEMTGQSH
jgi:hypothetical protein